MTTPTPGQPLSEADVSLLQPEDILKIDTGGGLYRFVRAKSKPSRLICAKKVEGSVERFYDRCRFTFVERPHAPVSRPGDGVVERVVFTPEHKRRAFALMNPLAEPVSREADLFARLDAILVEEDRMHPIGCASWEEEARIAIDMAKDRVLSLLSPAAPDAGGGALMDIAAERRRQVDVHGWSLDHDDHHDRGEIANAAADYASTGQQPISTSWAYGSKVIDKEPRRQQLVKAGALIVAEIERLDRAALQPGGER